MGEDVEIVYASTAEVAALLASGEAEYATLIEPQVTSGDEPRTAKYAGRSA